MRVDLLRLAFPAEPVRRTAAFARTRFSCLTSRRPLPDRRTRTVTARPPRVILNLLLPRLSFLRFAAVRETRTARAVSSLSVPVAMNGHLTCMPTSPRAVTVSEADEIVQRLELDTETAPLVTASQS